MTLTDEQLKRAGGAALTLLDLAGRTELLSDAWIPMRNGGFVRFGEPGSHFEGPAADAVENILDQLTNDLSETDEFWGVAFPRCPGHAHPSSYATENDSVVLRCPTSGDEIRRVTP